VRDKLCIDPVVYADGHFDLPQTPGLGTELDEEMLRSLTFRPQPYKASSEPIWR